MGRRTIVLVIAIALAAVSAFAVWRYLTTVESDIRADITEVQVYRATELIEAKTTGEDAQPFIEGALALRENVVFEGKRGFRYQFSYRAQNELGSWGDFVEYPDDYWVFINNPPVANGGPDQLVTEGDTVQFSADGSEDRDGDSLTYTWDFGDGSTSSELFATHKYKDPGLYVATLTVSDGYEESTARITVYVEEQAATPGFSGAYALVGILVAVLVAIGLSRVRKQ